jgi:flagellar hook protein FlgE
MASTTALFTGLSGLGAHARKLDVIGNNIANVNTTAYKSSRMMFANLFSRTLNMGAAPEGNFGGTNPSQIGMGVKIGATQRDMTGGSLSGTGVNTDVAIEGKGFFVVENTDGLAYTRAGNFQLNENNELVTMTGDRVQGYGVDDDFNIVRGTIRDITLPVGELTIARATENVHVGGNLNAAGDVGTRGTVIESEGLTDVLGNVITAATTLTRVQDPDAGAGTPLFADGETIRLAGAAKDSQQLPDADLDVTGATTVQDLLDFFNDVFGIVTGQGITDENDAVATSGAQLDSATGAIRLLGNTGTVNDLELETANFVHLDADGAVLGNPITFGREQSANGESVRTQFVTYDSLGTELLMNLSFVMESKSDSGNTWRYYMESADDTDLDRRLTLPASPLISFDPWGNPTGETSFNVEVDRDDSGAATPLTFNVDLNSESGALQQLADPGGDSEIAASFQDGVPIGTLNDFGVIDDGRIMGSFSNGLTRTIGALPLAVFRNDAGLEDIGNNLYKVGPNSGSPTVVDPQTFGAGRTVGSTLELSNVDLSNEFTDLILTQTGYTANTRVISTTNEMMQQLLLLGR